MLLLLDFSVLSLRKSATEVMPGALGYGMFDKWCSLRHGHR